MLHRANGDRKRIMVTLPHAVVSQLDELIVCENCSRSRMVHRILNMYFHSRQSVAVQLEQMRCGYEEMARINLALAEEGVFLDDEKGLRRE